MTSITNAVTPADKASANSMNRLREDLVANHTHNGTDSHLVGHHHTAHDGYVLRHPHEEADPEFPLSAIDTHVGGSEAHGVLAGFHIASGNDSYRIITHRTEQVREITATTSLEDDEVISDSSGNARGRYTIWLPAPPILNPVIIANVVSEDPTNHDTFRNVYVLGCDIMQRTPDGPWQTQVRVGVEFHGMQSLGHNSFHIIAIGKKDVVHS